MAVANSMICRHWGGRGVGTLGMGHLLPVAKHRACLRMVRLLGTCCFRACCPAQPTRFPHSTMPVIATQTLAHFSLFSSHIYFMCAPPTPSSTPQYEDIKATLRLAGDLARTYGQRLTFHPRRASHALPAVLASLPAHARSLHARCVVPTCRLPSILAIARPSIRSLSSCHPPSPVQPAATL